MRCDQVTAGLALGHLADHIFGDPARWHPVAGFGAAAARSEKHLYRPTRAAGVLHGAALVGSTALLGLALERSQVPQWLTVAGATWVVLGGRSLEREAQAMAELLAHADPEPARARIRHLVGRDPSHLDHTELARATVESVAENGADAVVSPLFWGAVAGVPGLLTYRAINTLDAMVGHRSPRYESFGWACARLDDAANWLPARLTVVLTAAVAPTRARAILRAVRDDAPAHPSPNAGPVEAAFAAALGRTLGGTNHYDGYTEERGRLGDGPAVDVGDIRAAVCLQRRISMAALVTVVLARAMSGPH